MVEEDGGAEDDETLGVEDDETLEVEAAILGAGGEDLAAGDDEPGTCPLVATAGVFFAPNVSIDMSRAPIGFALGEGATTTCSLIENKIIIINNSSAWK